ncbi:sialidase family protein [Parabacteroides sp. Marseille-P3160]|uniref:sialidase family protein n=1 Tax=Parabacteroides sp. Marseille-P3160 TaxID=1917887 RepID=UPI0009BB7C8C|nr:sialidase family protein [Parabacteroides sp. Marseille-P3160]
MRKLISCFYLLLIFVTYIGAQEIVQIKHPRLPILIDRQDNILFYLRVNTDILNSKILNNVTVSFDKEINPNEIKAVKLYYSGIENVQRKGKEYFSPVQYISRDIPGKTLAANTSYSIKKSEVTSIKNEITLSADQNMIGGINYFWISIEMHPQASIHSQIRAQIKEIIIDGKPVLNRPDKKTTYYLGVGVRHAGDDGVAAYRIPGMATSNKGTLLAVYDARYNNSSDLQEYIDIGLSRSTDGGQTWEPMRIPIKFEEYGGLPKAQNGVGDPAILVDKKSGTIWIVAVWTHGMGNGRAWFNSQQGMTIDKTAQLVMAKSDDDGKTWSEPINITEQLKQPEWSFLLQGPGNGITMEDGTIVFANQFIGADGIPNAGIMYSKDHGKTWHTHNYARCNTTEAQVAEVSKGVLMLNMRDNRGGSRAVYTTTDLGKTWNEHESSRTALQEPVCMASLIKIAAKDNIFRKDILLFSNPNTIKERKNITIKASMDGGLTWLPENQLLIDEEHGWGYSCLSQVDKETVGILYESSVAHMTYQAFKLTDIIKKP